MNYANLFNSCQAQDFVRELRMAVEKAQRPPDQVILDEVALCEMLHISKRHAADLRAEGKLKYAKDGGKLYYKLSWVLEYIDKYTVKPPASFINDVRKVCRSY
jgi:hypothetical protein